MKKLKQWIKQKLGAEKTARIKRLLPAARAIKHIVCWVLVIMLATAVITFFFLRSSGDSPTVFGVSLHRIDSVSMQPTLLSGDIIINTDVHDPAEVSEGDIITFTRGDDPNAPTLTSRVISAPSDTVSGYTLLTKGDANDEDDGEIDFSAVRSKYVRKAGFLTFVYRFFFSGWGIAVFILLLALIFFDRIRTIVRLTSERYREEDEDDGADDVEDADDGGEDEPAPDALPDAPPAEETAPTPAEEPADEWTDYFREDL